MVNMSASPPEFGIQRNCHTLLSNFFPVAYRIFPHGKAGCYKVQPPFLTIQVIDMNLHLSLA